MIPSPSATERSVRADRWEHGSDLELSLETGSADLPWAGHPHGLWGSGRDALRGLLAWGRDVHDWERVLIPTYACPAVVAAAERDLPVERYASLPTRPDRQPLTTRPGDVVVVSATFGMRPTTQVLGPAVVVEDRTHDPLSPPASGTRADYVVASLRKALPLPDGGVLWSPLDRDIAAPPEMTREHGRAAAMRFEAMLLKRRYLSGKAVDKGVYRDLAVRGEMAIGSGAISGISRFSRERLQTLPTQRLSAARAANLQVFHESVRGLPGVRLLDAPFAATLVFVDPEHRDRVRQRLAAERIYTAILWPLDEDADAVQPHVELSRRILSIHCDHRYGPDDMERVAAAVRRAVAAP